jgi:hypothetical protein
MGVGGDFMFSVFPVIFGIFFIIIFGMIIFTVARGISEWGKNNNSPRIPAEARISAKRLNVSGGGIYNDGVGNTHHYASTTTYYATFEFKTGDRKEFRVPYKEYGMLAEGDEGVLTFQGTRYISFEREIK